MTPKIRQRRRGFSLVEVLAALTVLSVLMLLLGRLFADSSSAYRAGVGRMDMDGGARAALEFMARELAAAQVNDRVTMRVAVNPTAVLGRSTDRITFLSLYNKPEYRSGNPYREGMQVRYTAVATAALPNQFFIARQVVEQEDSANYRAYTDPNWTTVFDGFGATGDKLVENVCGFRVLVTDRTGAVRTNYDSTAHPPPLWADLYLEVLSAEDAKRVEVLTGAPREDYIQRKARRYTQRVLFHNRQQPLTW